MSLSMKQIGSVKQPGAVLRRPTLLGRAAGIWGWLMRAFQAVSTRRALAELDDRALADLGISRAQARFEAGRAFWDLGDVPHR